ncbi:hypothetical protein [Bradyrhizobium sp. 191]|uniref:hypothetical protein n=1 Tax=Bradyrhizobium sp. 191 TaxID=2782659 RepID=UPI0020004288|nr:hypothetical protein [Bradyrhizobium sp. 191]UPJ62704.1 hypothetical protein IVB23_21910 [Bradyrhizobium sp. 191]
MPTGHGTVSLGGAIATAAVAAVGWTLAYFLTGWREDRTKRLQLELEHASEQIREFYAPLAALTDQLDSTADVYDRVIEGKSEEERDALSGLFYARFFLPIHEQINEILKKKVHLLEGPTPPKSFTYYFQHYATEKAYWNLRGEGKDVSNVVIPPYPSEFYWDVRKDYHAVLQRYEDTLQELRQRRWLFNFLEVSTSRARAIGRGLRKWRLKRAKKEPSPPA